MNETMLGSISERGLQGLVASLAKFCGWASYHTFDSRRSEPGFPDCVFVRGKDLLFVELKTEKGKVTAAQQHWLGMLAEAGAETQVWRPSSWPEIEQRLRLVPR